MVSSSSHSRWFRHYTAMVQIQSGSTLFWTPPLWWVGNARLTLRTNCSESLFLESQEELLFSSLDSCVEHVPLIYWFALSSCLALYVSCCSKSPNKSEFIKAKYQMLAFVHRMPCREDDSSTAKDLSKVRRKLTYFWLTYFWLKPFFLGCVHLLRLFPPQQLHSSVRTGNLETCLRLLSLGAQANFFHPVSFTCCF